MDIRAKKIILLGVAVLLAGVAQAQRPFRLPASVLREAARRNVPLEAPAAAVLSSAEQAAQNQALQKNLLLSYKQAQEIQQSLQTPFMCQIQPTKKLSVSSPAFFKTPATQLYPSVPYLQTPKQLTQYFLTQNNLLAEKEQQRMSGSLNSLVQQAPLLKEQAALAKQPKNKIEWLASYIPSQVNTLFVGEMHGFPEIQQALSRLLELLRAQRPNQTILLFSEFLYKDFIWTPYHDPASHPFGKVWKTALDQRIISVGLEPSFVKDDPLFFEYKDKEGNIYSSSVWSSLEGMRLRHEHYNQVLQRYRQTYPEALFVVYTGANHSQYTSLFSLSQPLPADKTFVVSLYPSKRLAKMPANFLIGRRRPFFTSIMGEFDWATGGTFPQQVLYWQDKTSAHTAGFDVQLKLSTEDSQLLP